MSKAFGMSFKSLKYYSNIPVLTKVSVSNDSVWWGEDIIWFVDLWSQCMTNYAWQLNKLNFDLNCNFNIVCAKSKNNGKNQQWNVKIAPFSCLTLLILNCLCTQGCCNFQLMYSACWRYLNVMYLHTQTHTDNLCEDYKYHWYRTAHFSWQ